LVKVPGEYGSPVAGFDLETTERFSGDLAQATGNGDLIAVRVHIASVCTFQA
jgi:hypothetical protein